MYQLSYYFLEIRLRVFYLLLSLILTLITSYYYQFEILYIIGRPFLDLDQKFILIDLTEAFYTILRICGIISFLIIIPFFGYHFWSFYIPSRYEFERKSIKNFSIVFFFMFFVELLILYFVIFPKICEFLLSFQVLSSQFSPHSLNGVDFSTSVLHNKNSTNSIMESKSLFFQKTNNYFQVDDGSFLESKQEIQCKKLKEWSDSFLLHKNEKPFLNNKTNPLLPNTNSFDFFSDTKKAPIVIELTARLESYVKLSIRFYFIMLTLFQIPFIVVMFYYYNIVDCYILCKWRKFFIFSSLLIAAFVSPPDLISQSILAVFLYFLYEFLVFIGIFFEKILKKKTFI